MVFLHCYVEKIFLLENSDAKCKLNVNQITRFNINSSITEWISTDILKLQKKIPLELDWTYVVWKWLQYVNVLPSGGRYVSVKLVGAQMFTFVLY